MARRNSNYLVVLPAIEQSEGTVPVKSKKHCNQVENKENQCERMTDPNQIMNYGIAIFAEIRDHFQHHSSYPATQPTISSQQNPLAQTAQPVAFVATSGQHTVNQVITYSTKAGAALFTDKIQNPCNQV